jgi:hypothetical protein
VSARNTGTATACHVEQALAQAPAERARDTFSRQGPNMPPTEPPGLKSLVPGMFARSAGCSRSLASFRETVPR